MSVEFRHCLPIQSNVNLHFKYGGKGEALYSLTLVAYFKTFGVSKPVTSVNPECGSHYEDLSNSSFNLLELRIP